MGKKYLVEYDREGCIGAAACVAVQPDQWTIVDDGKADLKDSAKEGKNWFKEIDESELQAYKDAAESCPVTVIKIFEKDTKKRII
ncbi:MAG: ferredoxin [Nanoarchaeota archaeon]